MKRKSETISQLIVGAFMVVLMALLVYFTIVVSGVDLLRGRNRRMISVVFDQVGGLKERDNVMFRGTKVGVVEQVSVTPSNLVVTAMVDDGVVLRSGYAIKVCNLSMLGGNYLLLEEGAGEPIDYAGQPLEGITPNDWMQDVASISKHLNELASKPELHSAITNFEAVSAKASSFMDKANSIADNADRIVARLERGEGTMGKLMSSDDTVYADLSATLANAREVTDRVNHSQMLADLEAGVAAFRKAAEGFDSKATFEKANHLLDNLNAVAADLKDGKGTLGRLAKDPEMYEQIDGLIRDVRQVIDNYRDTTPISTFSSLAVGAL